MKNVLAIPNRYGQRSCSVFVIFINTFGDTQFCNIVRKISEKVQLRIVPMNFVHSVDIANRPVNVARDPIATLFHRFLPQRR